MNKISIGNLHYTAPSKWEEMTADQLKIWVEILSKNIEVTHALSFACIHLYKIPYKLWQSLIPAYHVQIKETLKFLTKSNQLTNWLITSFKIGLTTYYGPANKLSSITIEEFRHAEVYYLAYMKTKRPELLDSLISVLFRQKGKSEAELDNRIQFSPLIVQTNTAKMSGLHKLKKEAILFNYAGCRNFIFKKYPTIFKISKKEQSAGGIPDLINLISVVAGGKFGTQRETERTPLYNFLDHLEREIENADKVSK